MRHIVLSSSSQKEESNILPKTIEDCLNHLQIPDLHRRFAIAKIEYFLEIEKHAAIVKTIEEQAERFRIILEKLEKTFGKENK